eukprot:909395-Amphidinium_carterae.1
MIDAMMCNVILANIYAALPPLHLQRLLLHRGSSSGTMDYTIGLTSSQELDPVGATRRPRGSTPCEPRSL